MTCSASSENTKINGKHVLTGPFSYTGSFLAALLLKSGANEVHGLINHNRSVKKGLEEVKCHDLDFSNIEKLAKIMDGADVFYNTYWVRFNHKKFNHQEAVKNTKILFRAAQMASVKKIVHVSITNPSLESPFEYFSCKAELEQTLVNSGAAYSIIRPALIFGGKDILINNMAWALRRFPIFGVFGFGDYGLRPIYVEDMAMLMMKEGQNQTNSCINAVGPERFSYTQLIKKLAKILGLKRLILPCPPGAAYAVGKAIGRINKDVFLTWPEIKSLMSGLLDTEESFDEAPGRTLLTEWAAENRSTLGRHYASELARRKKSGDSNSLRL